MGRPLSTVLIGFGRIADQLGDDPLTARFFRFATHAQVLAAHPLFDWQAVVDLSDQALDRARTRWQVPHLVHDVNELIGRCEPDIAVIATPPGPRADIVAALPSLKGVMVEKPLASSMAEADALARICANRELAVQVNYWRRGVKTFRRLAKGQLESEIGRPQAVFATYGNGMFNNASHLVDFIRMMLGEIGEVQAAGEPTALAGASIPGDVDLAFTLTLECGAVAAFVPLDFAHYREVGVDIWGENGRATVLQEGLCLSHHRRVPNRGVSDASEVASDEAEVEVVEVADALYAMYDNLEAVIDHNEKLWSPLSSAMAAERVLRAALDSAHSGRTLVHLVEQ
jgi:predicted dehydrogenase